MNPIKALISTTLASLLFACSAIGANGQELLIPVVSGDWIQIAGDPDLGEYTTEHQQPVDFGVWQADDGTWQLWSCIRHTDCGGSTRLFYRWEGETLTSPDWTPMGIAMEADPSLGETIGGLQAPHVVRHDGLYYMAYGDWANICFATSEDGKTFKRIIQPDGGTGVFSEGANSHTRDPMLIQIDGLWHCYYTAVDNRQGYGFCRTSPDLKTWSRSCVVSYGGEIGPGSWNNECPFVVEPEPGVFYYFRNQYYGERAKNWVYRSDNPLNFGIDNDEGLVRTWRVAAPEIILYEGRYYVVSLMDSLKGIKIAPLEWITVPESGEAIFDFDDADVRAAWNVAEGDLPDEFTNSTRTAFDAKTEFFIGTAETDGDRINDAFTGVIESPPFTIDADGYVLYVSGGDDNEKLYVALIDAATGEELTRIVNAEKNNMLKAHRVNVAAFRDREAVVRIVDQGTESWGHVNFGGIYEDPMAAYWE